MVTHRGPHLFCEDPRVRGRRGASQSSYPQARRARSTASRSWQSPGPTLLQCDADLVGPVSAAADAESLIVMASVYAALDVGAVTIRMNDRRVLTGLLDLLGAGDQAVPVLRALDKRASR